MATPNDVLEGIKIIFKYSGEVGINDHCFQSEHDQIWCGDYNAEKMSDEDFVMMEKCGWFEDEDSWSLYT